MKLKKDDKVKITVGKDRGKTGKILKVYPDKGTVLVEGLNMFKKHRRPTRQGEKGEIINISRPIKVSNVQYICGNCGKTVRLGFRVEGDKKVRVCKKCGSTA